MILMPTIGDQLCRIPGHREMNETPPPAADSSEDMFAKSSLTSLPALSDGDGVEGKGTKQGIVAYRKEAKYSNVLRKVKLTK